MAEPDTLTRFTFVELARLAEDTDARDVHAGLSATPKTLPPRFFYDELGSCLFERICEQPEYYLTRTEEGILAGAADEIARITGPCDIVELGSGSARKTPVLIDAYARADGPLHYVPIDVNGDVVRASATGLLARFDGLRVSGIGGTYEQALAHLAREAAPVRMVVFLGSTIGNFMPAEFDDFLQSLAGKLADGDYFLVGSDLVKDKAVLDAAYNDRAGVTAAFNLNALKHLNRRYQGDFALAAFEHQALYVPEKQRIEMHLRSRRDQTVSLARIGARLSFAEGETIRTEVSHKFDLDDLDRTVSGHGFERAGRWTDDDGWFGVSLFRRRH